MIFLKHAEQTINVRPSKKMPYNTILSTIL